MLYLAGASAPGLRSNLKDISAAIESPEAFTAKILQQLVRHGLVNSLKGPTGGFSIPPERLSNLTLREVVVVFDGDTLLTHCALGLPECSALTPCPLHGAFLHLRNQLNTLLLSLIHI